jgi:transcriptional regulator with XRE-family HTH domain
MKGLGSFLREIREEKNLTLTDVYKKTGITDSRLSRIETESGKYSPPIADVIKLAELYNIDYDKILSFSTVYTRNNFRGCKNLLSNLEFLDKREIQHIQDEIDFIVGQKGTGRNEL